MSKSFYKNDRYASEEAAGKSSLPSGAERKRNRQALHNLVYFRPSGNDFEESELCWY